MQRTISILIIIGLFIIALLIVGLTPVLRQKSSAPATTTTTSSISEVAPMQPLTATASDQIIDLFQPSSDTLNQQLSSSQITSQIENAMVVSYTLMHCNLMTANEYSATFNALIIYSLRSGLEPDTTRAEARVRSIASAAAGSYSMVYGNTPCTDASLPPKAAALHQWRTAISK